MWKPNYPVFLCAQEPGLGLTRGVLAMVVSKEPEGSARLKMKRTELLLALKHPTAGVPSAQEL